MISKGYFYLTSNQECKFMTDEETNVVDLFQKKREKELEKLNTSPLSAQEIYDKAQKEYLLNRIKNIQENNKLVLERLKNRKR